MVQVSLTTKEILALLDDILQINFDGTFGSSRERYTNKTIKDDALFNTLIITASKKLKKAINWRDE